MEGHNEDLGFGDDAHQIAVIDPLAPPDPTSREQQEKQKSEKNNKRKEIVKLDSKLLLNEKGLPLLRRHGKIMKFYGRGREDEDLKRLMEFYQMWAHSLFPRLNMKDFSERVVKVCSERRCKEALGVWREELVQSKSIDNMQGGMSGITIEDNVINNGSTEAAGTEAADTDDIWSTAADPFSPPRTSPQPEAARTSGAEDNQQPIALTEEQKRRIEENRLKALAKRRPQPPVQEDAEEESPDMLWDPLEDLRAQTAAHEEEDYDDPGEEYM